MKYILTFFIFAILLIPIYLYYIDVISTINNTHLNHFKTRTNPKSLQDNDYVNGFNMKNIDTLKLLDFRHSNCLKNSFDIESDDFNSTRLMFIL